MVSGSLWQWRLDGQQPQLAVRLSQKRLPRLLPRLQLRLTLKRLRSPGPWPQRFCTLLLLLLEGSLVQRLINQAPVLSSPEPLDPAHCPAGIHAGRCAPALCLS